MDEIDSNIFCLGLTDVVRVTDENIPKYRQVNYDAMRAIIRERKLCGVQALERGNTNDFLSRSFVFYLLVVTKLQNDSHALQEQAELKVAREHWLHEQFKFNQQYQKYDQEHQDIVYYHSHSTIRLCLR